MARCARLCHVSFRLLPFAHCEFAFQSRTGTFMRYCSCDNITRLKPCLKSPAPVAISLGPVYTAKVGIWWLLACWGLWGMLDSWGLLLSAPGGLQLLADRKLHLQLHAQWCRGDRRGKNRGQDDLYDQGTSCHYVLS